MFLSASCPLPILSSSILSDFSADMWVEQKKKQLTVELCCNCCPVDVYREPFPLQDTFVYHITAQCPVLNESF